jgi:hypothetical protein
VPKINNASPNASRGHGSLGYEPTRVSQPPAELIRKWALLSCRQAAGGPKSMIPFLPFEL